DTHVRLPLLLRVDLNNGRHLASYRSRRTRDGRACASPWTSPLPPGRALFVHGGTSGWSRHRSPERAKDALDHGGRTVVCSALPCPMGKRTGRIRSFPEYAFASSALGPPCRSLGDF